MAGLDGGRSSDFHQGSPLNHPQRREFATNCCEQEERAKPGEGGCPRLGSLALMTSLIKAGSKRAPSLLPRDLEPGLHVRCKNCSRKKTGTAPISWENTSAVRNIAELSLKSRSFPEKLHLFHCKRRGGEEPAGISWCFLDDRGDAGGEELPHNRSRRFPRFGDAAELEITLGGEPMRRGDNKWDTEGWQEGQPRAAHPGRESEELSPKKSLLCLSSQLQT